jgi:hypothetical protein
MAFKMLLALDLTAAGSGAAKGSLSGSSYRNGRDRGTITAVASAAFASTT